MTRAVQARRVVSFLGGKGPLHMGCFVCRREPERHWQAAAVSLFEQVDMHCAAHAAAFHAVVRHRFICCAPPYDPARDYAWRREGRALLAQPAESESEPDDTHVPDPSEAFLRSVTSRNRAAGLAFLTREPPEWNDFLASASDHEQSGSLHRSQNSEREQ